MSEELPLYAVRRADTPPTGRCDWDSPVWSRADPLQVRHFHVQSSDHRPRVEARMLYDDTHLYGLFRVQDRYVVCRHMTYQASVCQDSCVEFFARPRPDKGYLNFEMNCAGTLLLSYIVDATRIHDPEQPGKAFADYEVVPPEVGERVRRFSSLSGPIEKEIVDARTWFVEFHIPVPVFEHYVGPLGTLTGQEWRANFFKCADQSSHPHWAAWSPVGHELNFHQPRRFGVLRFA